ncbi:hypothetical protein D9M68_349020 [compost metagenome]
MLFFKILPQPDAFLLIFAQMNIQNDEVYFFGPDRQGLADQFHHLCSPIERSRLLTLQYK